METEFIVSPDMISDGAQVHGTVSRSIVLSGNPRYLAST